MPQLPLGEQKLQLEVAELRNRSSKYWKRTLEAIQTVAILLGIYFGINEFILKTSEKKINKTRSTLDYAAKITDPIISESQNELEKYAKMLSHVVSKKEYDSVFQVTHEEFERSTRPLANYFNILQSGIKNDYFDKSLSDALLDANTTKIIQTLSEIQGRHRGMRNSRSKPNYMQFKSLIEFYIGSHDTASNYGRQTTPHYDIDKPFKYVRGRSGVPLEEGEF